MAKTKAQKAEEIKAVADRFGRAAGAVFTDFTGVKIHEMEALRRASRKEGCEYLVVKKTLLRRAAEVQHVPVDTTAIVGSVSVLFGFQDPVAPAKVMKDFVRAHPAMRLIGGLMREGVELRALDVAAVTALGDLPSRDELRARLVGSLASPLRGMVGVLQGNLRKLVYVLHAVQQAKA